MCVLVNQMMMKQEGVVILDSLVSLNHLEIIDRFHFLEVSGNSTLNLLILA